MEERKEIESRLRSVCGFSDVHNVAYLTMEGDSSIAMHRPFGFMLLDPIIRAPCKPITNCAFSR